MVSNYLENRFARNSCKCRKIFGGKLNKFLHGNILKVFVLKKKKNLELNDLTVLLHKKAVSTYLQYYF